MSNMGEDPLVLVGEITAPFGILGQIKMRPLLDKPEALAKLAEVCLRFPDGRESAARITRVRAHGVSTLIEVRGTTDRTGAESLRGALILIHESELPPLDEDAYYASQLVGLRVVTESGRDFGNIETVLFCPANDVYETEHAMIPAISDVIVKIDLAAGIVLVRDVPGLRKDE